MNLKIIIILRNKKAL